MKKASLIASAAIASVVLGAVPAFAQGGGPFADVPTDHWAYQAVDKLQKAGIVIGYPDGTYGGKRAMTRYEFAVAIARLIDKIPNFGIEAGVQQPGGGITREELDRILADYAKKSDLAGFMTREEADQLRRLVQEFQTELTALGVDVDRLRQRLDALEGRVAFIERELKRVQITGGVNLMIRGNHRQGSRERAFTDQDGFLVTGGPGTRGSILSDVRVLHDFDLGVKARLSDTATAEAILNFGNYLDFLGGISSFNGARSDRNLLNGVPGQLVSQNQEQTLYRLTVNAPVSFFGMGVDLTVGRLPIQFTDYTLKLVDVDNYFRNDKTDLGEIPVDGAKAIFNLGPVGATVFAAKVDPIKYVSNYSGKIVGDPGYRLFAGASRAPFASNIAGQRGGFRGGVITALNESGNPADRFLTGNRPKGSVIATGFNPAAVPAGLPGAIRPDNGAMAVDQIAGARLTFGNSRFGTIGGNFVALSGLAPLPSAGGLAANFDRVFVYGADLNSTIVGVGLTASYTKSDTAGPRAAGTGNIDAKISSDNFAFDVALNYATGGLTIGGGYKEIGPLFGAPGYWGRIGSWTNPVDIAGGYVKGSYALGGGYIISAIGQIYEGSDEETRGSMDTNSGIRNYRVGLQTPAASWGNVDLGVEYTEYELANSGNKPWERFINLGYGYAFNPNTSFKLLYQLVSYDDKGTRFDSYSGDGGVGAAQFSVKF